MYLKELEDAISDKCMIKREIRMKIKELKSEQEDEIDILEWRLRMEKISMKDDDEEDEYFQKMKLDEIKERLKREIDKINESITIEEWRIDDGDGIVKLKDYITDIEEELKIKDIILKQLKFSDEKIDEITSHYFGWLEWKRFFTFSIVFLIFFQFVFFLQTCYDICFFHILVLYFFPLQIILCIYFLLSLLIILCYFHNNPLLCLKSRLCFFDNKLFFYIW